MYEYAQLFEFEEHWNLYRFSKTEKDMAVTRMWNDPTEALNELSRDGWDVCAVYVKPHMGDSTDSDELIEYYLLRKKCKLRKRKLA
jgi:hypothetical protein